ncbi:uncharacterized protein GIQ15_01722 [Arthroderma uncinatum]|uniref:uncharacterized protein n=1 Tax=Arthroderma uncinatum TaxID=74035 RepID=UPI00144A710C|nr:uncharacterized protein GIQ15_01722 [Arthroderma uncinatum]KAF3492205.1 hypothetical protein GIQ15_01722 [Arthroderma uncinatum]
MMSPAVADAAGRNDELRALAKGFVALLEAAQKLTRQEQELQSRLQYTLNEYQKLASKLPEGSDNKLDITIGPTLDSTGPDDAATDNVEWVTSMEKAGYISPTETKNITESLEISTAALRKLEITQDPSTLRTCPFGHGKRRTSMEHDFTTNGIKGTLGCPFNKSSKPLAAGEQTDINGESCENDEDPIKLDKMGEGAPSTARSVHSSSARCPIRYLEDHSPEELAEYFENHKHEIPRSHSVCIRRYQNNPQTSRHIDAKYGDVVNMVKGLGEYHQPYLSTPHELDETGEVNAGAVTGSSSVDRVEKWAEDVSNKTPPRTGSPSPEEAEVTAPVPGDQHASPGGDDEREGHFERPLRDVRVGESPSRPWGIHVPPEQPAIYHPPESHYDKPQEVEEDPTMLLPSQGRLSPLGQASTFGNDAEADADANITLGATAEEDLHPEPEIDEPSSHHAHSHQMPHTNTQTNTYSVPRSNLSPDAPMAHISSPQPRMVFNGPVFFGYTAEAAALLLEKMGHK